MFKSLCRLVLRNKYYEKPFVISQGTWGGAGGDDPKEHGEYPSLSLP